MKFEKVKQGLLAFARELQCFADLVKCFLICVYSFEKITNSYKKNVLKPSEKTVNE